MIWPPAPMCLGGIFDYADKKERLAEVELELAEPDVWNDAERAQALGRERSALEAVVATIDGHHIAHLGDPALSARPHALN